MASIDLRIEGTFVTRAANFYYPDFKENGFRPTDVEDPAELARLVKTVDPGAYCLGLTTYDKTGAHLNLQVASADLVDGELAIEAEAGQAKLRANVNGLFRLTVDDPETLKHLKKDLKSGLGFSVTHVHFKREEIGFSPFGLEGGVIDGIDWNDYAAMPQAQLVATDIVKLDAKPDKSRAKAPLQVPIKANLSLALDPDVAAATQEALSQGLQLNVGLEIKGGVNQFIVKPEQIKGACSIAMSKNTLKLKIDGHVDFKEDAWVRKYRDRAPFAVTLDSYWDAQGVKRYLGPYNTDLGYNESIPVGELKL